MPEPETPEPDTANAAAYPDAPDAAPTCPWCATPNAADASVCRSCGAALAQRDSIGDLMIPGLTSVDPALQDFDKRPLHLSGPSPSQGMAPALIAGAMAGGPIGLAAIGGVAAVAAVEYLGAGRGAGNMNLEDVGRPSEVVLQALGRIEGGSAAPEGERATSDGAQGAAFWDAGTARVDAAPEPDAAAADHGRSIWRDLPPVDESHQPTDEEARHGDG